MVQKKGTAEVTIKQLEKELKELKEAFDELEDIDLKTDIGEIHSHNLDIKRNQIYLFGEEAYTLQDDYCPGVEFVMANRFIKNMQYLTNRSDKPIIIHMKSGGGTVTEGFAIYSTIRACPNKTSMVVYTEASSMSSVILQAADRRILFPYSEFMIHLPWKGAHGNTKDFDKQKKDLERTENVMFNIYTDRMKNTEGSKFRTWSLKRIRKWLEDAIDKEKDLHLTPDQAVQYGLADEVFKHDWNGILSNE